MRVTILNRTAAEVALRTRNDFTYVVSINDPGIPPPVEVCRSNLPSLVLHMRDVDSENVRYAPDAQDIELLVELAQELTLRDHVLVHCRLGQRRSAAAALVLLAVALAGVPASSIVAALRSLKGDISPNRLMVRLTDEKLGYEGRLIRAVDDVFG